MWILDGLKSIDNFNDPIFEHDFSDFLKLGLILYCKMISNFEMVIDAHMRDLDLMLMSDKLIGVLEVLREISGSWLIHVQHIHDFFGVLIFHLGRCYKEW